MVGDHPNDAPPDIREEFQALDIATMLHWVVPVLRPVVFHPHLPLRPTHVDAPSTDPDLGDRPRQTAPDEKQSDPRFLRRLCATVGESEYPSQPPDASRPRVPLGNCRNRLDANPRRVHQCVDADQPFGERKPSPQVVRRPFGCGATDSGHEPNFVSRHPAGMRDDPDRRAVVGAEEFGGNVVGNPTATQKCGSRHTCHGRLTARRQPGGHCSVAGSQRRALGDVHVAIYPVAPAHQFSAGEATGRQCVGCDDELWHSAIVRATTGLAVFSPVDNPAEKPLSYANRGSRREKVASRRWVTAPRPCSQDWNTF
jgi:hypothetical protein